MERVHDGALDVEVERVAKLVELGVVGAFATEAVLGDLVLAERVGLELGIKLNKGALADLASAARGQLPA